MEEPKKNEHGHYATPFDGKKALIVGDHPHANEVATCLGADKLVGLGCFGLYFKGAHNDFYVTENKNIKWTG